MKGEKRLTNAILCPFYTFSSMHHNLLEEKGQDVWGAPGAAAATINPAFIRRTPTWRNFSHSRHAQSISHFSHFIFNFPPAISSNYFHSTRLVLHKLNIQRIGKLPYGAKRGFIEGKDLLKERLYWRRKKMVKIWMLEEVM